MHEMPAFPSSWQPTALQPTSQAECRLSESAAQVDRRSTTGREALSFSPSPMMGGTPRPTPRQRPLKRFWRTVAVLIGAPALGRAGRPLLWTHATRHATAAAPSQSLVSLVATILFRRFITREWVRSEPGHSGSLVHHIGP